MGMLNTETWNVRELGQNEMELDKILKQRNIHKVWSKSIRIDFIYVNIQELQICKFVSFKICLLYTSRCV